MLRRGRTALTRAATPGFTLVEVLVAAAVASLAILGAASLQLATLRAMRDALEQALATHLAADIAERMLSMPAVAPVLACDPCRAASATTDLAGWLAMVEATLPSSRALIAVDAGAATPPRRMQIRLDWGDDPVLGRSYQITAALPTVSPP